jgi:hypothetical protein
MALNPFFEEGPRREFYFLGNLTKTVEDYSVRVHRVENFRKTFPLFVIYDFERKLAKGTGSEGLSPKLFYKRGKIVVPEFKIVEGFSFYGKYVVDDLDIYSEIEKRTSPKGVERVQWACEGWHPVDLTKWDPEILRRVRKLPVHVRDVIGLQ